MRKNKNREKKKREEITECVTDSTSGRIINVLRVHRFRSISLNFTLFSLALSRNATMDDRALLLEEEVVEISALTSSSVAD